MLDSRPFKENLLTLRDNLLQRVDALAKDLHHEDEAIEKDFAEQATQLENDEVLNALDDEAKKELMQINKALLRIENSTFGICVGCGEAMSEARLKAIPYAERCVQCTETALLKGL